MALLSWGRRWRLQFLGLAVFGFGIWRRIRVLGLLLLHPHVCVQTSLGQQLLVPCMETRGSEFIAVITECTVEHGGGGDTYVPRSAICPLLTTRIWSAPIIVDNLWYMNKTKLIRRKKRHWHPHLTCLSRIYLVKGQFKVFGKGRQNFKGDWTNLLSHSSRCLTCELRRLWYDWCTL